MDDVEEDDLPSTSRIFVLMVSVLFGMVFTVVLVGGLTKFYMGY